MYTGKLFDVIKSRFILHCSNVHGRDRKSFERSNARTLKSAEFVGRLCCLRERRMPCRQRRHNPPCTGERCMSQRCRQRRRRPGWRCSPCPGARTCQAGSHTHHLDRIRSQQLIRLRSREGLTALQVVQGVDAFPWVTLRSAPLVCAAGSQVARAHRTLPQRRAVRTTAIG